MIKIFNNMCNKFQNSLNEVYLLYLYILKIYEVFILFNRLI